MTRIFVGNLSYDATTQEVRDLFSAYGMVKDAKVLTDRETGRSRGFGFVEMEDAEDARTAIAECDGMRMMGRDIVVNEAKPRGEGGGIARGEGGSRSGGYQDRPNGVRHPAEHRDDGGRGRRDRGR